MRTGYRPQFYYDGYDWDALLEFAADDWIDMGQTVEAKLRFLTPENHRGKLHAGKEFLLREGMQVIGYGKVTKILGLDE